MTLLFFSPMPLYMLLQVRVSDFGLNGLISGHALKIICCIKFLVSPCFLFLYFLSQISLLFQLKCSLKQRSAISIISFHIFYLQTSMSMKRHWQKPLLSLADIVEPMTSPNPGRIALIVRLACDVQQNTDNN